MSLFDLRVPEEEDDDYLPLLKRPLLGAPHSSPCDSLADAFEVFIERRASTGGTFTTQREWMTHLRCLLKIAPGNECDKWIPPPSKPPATGHWVNRVFCPTGQVLSETGQVLSETGQVLSETDEQPPAVEDLNAPIGKYVENWLA